MKKGTEELHIHQQGSGNTGKSARQKVLEFEHERVGYIDTIRQLLEDPGGRAVSDDTPEDGGRRGQEGRGDGELGQRSRLLRRSRQAFRERDEEIRLLRNQKVDAAVRLQGERLSNLEQELELEVLRLERLLDRERIMELLRLTDPNRPSEAAAAARGVEGVGSASGGGDMVPEAVIQELEDRAAAAEETLARRAAELRQAVASRLEQRAGREELTRREGVVSGDEVGHLQALLADKEDRLARTVFGYVELRHAMLCAQRVSSEARQEAQDYEAWQAEEVRRSKAEVVERRRASRERLEKACESQEQELERQIQLREGEARLLLEQHAQAEQLYAERAQRLEALLDEWKSRHRALRRRFALETEGFRRDAEEIGRRFDRIRAGPRGAGTLPPTNGGSSDRGGL